VVSGNGEINFDVSLANNGTGYVINDTDHLPIITNSIRQNAIFGALHDIDITVNNGSNNAVKKISYTVYGTAPYRAFVANYYRVAHYGTACASYETTQQIVLYETTNIIEIFLQDKPTCTAHNHGNAIVGIQNIGATQAFFPPSRNGGSWAAANEAWRFVPDGAPNYSVEWYDQNNVLVGTAPTVNVCTPATQTYTANVIYHNCDNQDITISDDVTVHFDQPFDVSISGQSDVCDTQIPYTLSAVVTNIQTGVSVTGYEWYAASDLSTVLSTISDLTINTSDTYEVHVFSSDGCEIIIPITIQVYPEPIAQTPPDQVLCDDAVADGFTTFTLSNTDVTIMNGQTGMVVTYYANQADADNATNPLPDSYSNTSNPQTIYARLEYTVLGTCYDTTNFQISVDPSPSIIPISDLIMCENGMVDGIALFDLTTKDLEIIDGQTDMAVTYYDNPTDAQNATNPLASPYSNTSNPQTIYFRLEDTITGCFSISNFQIQVQPIFVIPDDLRNCDLDNDGFTDFDLETLTPIIQNGNTALVITYHNTFAEANANTNALVSPYTNISAPETIFIRVDDPVTGCYAITDFALIVLARPIIFPHDDIEICDDDIIDGFAPFNLNYNNAQIIGTQIDVNISFHLTQQDADDDLNPLPIPYTNITNPQTIYIRLESIYDPACYTTDTMILTVEETPFIVGVTDFSQCDTDGVLDGTTPFDLTTKDIEIINGMANVVVTYHLDFNDADFGLNPLVSPYTNISNPQTIYPRAFNTVTGCYAVSNFDLIVTPLAGTAVDRYVCDSDTDGFAAFDLSTQSPNITLSLPDLTVTYHETWGQAQTGSSPLTLNYTNISNPQTIHYHLENTVSGCASVGVFQLNVNQIPSITTISDLVLCDDQTQDGIVSNIDLTQKDIEALNGQANVNVSYYTSQTDADAATNAITGTYTNTADPQTIYVRLESASLSSCYDTTSFEIDILQSVSLPPMTDLALCDDATADGLTTFDLTDQDTVIINGQANMAVTYYLNQTDALNDTSALPNSYTNIVNPQLIYARLENTVTHCFDLTSFNLQVHPNPIISSVTTLEVCDVDQDLTASFDLTVKDSEIINGQADMSVFYYPTLADAQNHTNVITGNTTNTGNPQIYYYRLENNTTHCYGISQFNTHINPAPIIPVLGTFYTCEDDKVNGSTDFDLISHDPEVINGQANMSVNYYSVLSDAEAGINPLESPYTNFPNPQTIYARLNNDLTGCFAIAPFNLEVAFNPEVTTLNNLEICDPMPEDGIATFDLTPQIAALLNGQTGFNVSFHASLNDADFDINPLTLSYQNTVVNQQTIYARIENVLLETCYDTTTFDLIVTDLPMISSISDLEVCDTNNDLTEWVNLTDKDLEIINGQTDVVVTYYPSSADALADTNAIIGLYQITTNPQIIYYSLENTTTLCVNYGQFNVVLNPTPTAVSISDFLQCDDDYDGLNSFDLTLKDTEILNGQTDVSVSYYENLTDAQNATNAITSTYTNTANPQTIYVRLENNTTLCYTTTSFLIEVLPLPVLNTITTLENCDDLPEDGFTTFDLTDAITEALVGQTALTATIHTSQADADANLNPVGLSFTNTVANTQTLYIRIENPNPLTCYAVNPFDVQVNPLPLLTNISNVEVCDLLNDTSEMVNLSDQETNILNGQTGMSVTYYNSFTDAENASNPMSDPYTINLGTETIFYRIEDSTTSCFRVSSFDVELIPVPVIVSISDIEVCDDNNDQIWTFDLSLKDAEILNGQTGVSISYYLSIADAESATDPLSSPYANTTNPQTIFVRLEDDVTHCFNIGSFVLNVLQLPINYLNHDIETCASDWGVDSMPFDLLAVYGEVLSGPNASSVQLTFHNSDIDAQNGDNPITITNSYLNTSNPQTIYIRLWNSATDCTTWDSFELIVVPVPFITEPTPLEVCDPDSDGFHVFDLHLKDSEIAGTLVGTVAITYHETLTDAQQGITDIPNYAAYSNITPGSQIIFVRMENMLTGCFDITTLQLIVNPTPQINFNPADFEVCDDNYDGFRQVDLTTHYAEILGSVPLADVQISFYHSEAEAEAEVNMIVNDIAYTNTSNPETIWVRVEYPLTNCATIVSFDLVINPLPVLITPEPLSLCDNSNDGEDANGFVQSFMLTDMDAVILNGQTGIVSYHRTQAEAESGTNAIASPFTNEFQAVQTLWVRVEIIGMGCYALTTLDVRVNPLPTPVVPQPVEACDLDDDGFAEFELDAALVFEIQNGENGTAITFYETYQDAVDDVNPITTPYTSISVADNSQIIYARDTYTDTGCFRIVEVLLRALETPQPVDPTDFNVCDDNNDGFYTFDLNLKTAEILGSIDPTTVIITYHQSQADADSGTNIIDLGELYNNLSNPQTIYVRVESVANGCFNTVHFNLIVNLVPEVIVPTPMELCDADPTDGIERAFFDLESKVAEILNGQVGLIVYFYETLAQAEANDVANSLTSPYANIDNPQTIFVRLQGFNDTCYNLTTMDLRVLPSPNANYTPRPIELCDNFDDMDAANGFVQTFDLNLASADIINGQPNVSIAYYTTLIGAQTLDPLLLIDTSVDYINVVAFNDTVYAVVTDLLSPMSCSVIVPVQLIVNPLPQVANFTEYLYCEVDNNEMILADLHDMDIYVLLNPADLPLATITYHLTAVDGVTGLNPLPSPRILHEGDILYAHVAFTDSKCSNSLGPITIHIDQRPSVTEPSTMYACDTAADGDNTNGIGVPFDLSLQDTAILNGQTGMTVTYYLSLLDSQLEQNVLTLPYSNTTNPQMIYARVENNVTHCYNFTNFSIAVNDPPHFSIPEPDLYCIGEAAVHLQPITDGDTYTYEWTDGSTIIGNNPLLVVTAAGTYSLTLTTPQGCSETQSVTVDDSQGSLLTLADLVITTFENNNTLTIPTGIQYGIGDYQYSVDGSAFSDQVFYENLDGGNHTLVIIDQNGCKTITITFVILDYMRFFTPNDDGYNDTWNILGGWAAPNTVINIFDRFGKHLASIDPTGPGWDGKFNGLPLPSTDYWFTIELEDGFLLRGHFSLVRR
jgi:gliding motility-associated-like protein